MGGDASTSLQNAIIARKNQNTTFTGCVATIVAHHLSHVNNQGINSSCIASNQNLDVIAHAGSSARDDNLIDKYYANNEKGNVFITSRDGDISIRMGLASKPLGVGRHTEVVCANNNCKFLKMADKKHNQREMSVFITSPKNKVRVSSAASQEWLRKKICGAPR